MPTPTDNVALNTPDPEHLPDKVGGPTTTGTVGCTFKYQYPTGPQYRISFSKKLVYFTVPALSDGTTVLALPYQQREVRPNLFLVHWIGPGRQGHVALKRMDCVALMPAGLYELFDRAEFNEVYENGKSALYAQYE
ncbi:uncharacterized protein N7529_001016 [Penicillium soppii]|uniref:uncharacterized protein n=1 Tax=Penicillium soppii TaxID=69789 RepID=UPI002546F48A|nr:uncharacterized protein N7529_001016 [Penicillium soppii]KAJ5882344.1 hypothetical protein N7529_001016 [Penicillium soppii]